MWRWIIIAAVLTLALLPSLAIGYGLYCVLLLEKLRKHTWGVKHAPLQCSAPQLCHYYNKPTDQLPIPPPPRCAVHPLREDCEGCWDFQPEAVAPRR